MLTSFAEIIEKAKTGKRKKIVVADASGKSVIDALKQAYDAGIIEPILVGDATKIKPLVEEFKLTGAQIIDIVEPEKIGAHCIELIRDGKAEMLMKGKLSTPILMKAVLDKEKGLRKGKLLSHIAAMEIAGYPKIMLMTDGGTVICPDLNEKIALIENAANVARGLGAEKPKVACLAAIEQVNEKQPETLHAAELVKMSERGQLGKVEVEGPIAMDVLLSHDAAKAKGIESKMTLDADIILVPNIAVCNAFVKGMIYLANAKVGGVVMGATCPIVLLSRSDTAEIKLYSIALACVVS